MPLPFPEALQEFKVETSALPAQYGFHSAAAVTAVTKSGTNRVTGTAFEFLRDDSLNAKDPFAPIGTDGIRRSDGLNRNQFGGAIGGPIVRDNLFYFAAYQRTRIRRTPTSSFQFVPTQAMLNGDFTAIASAASEYLSTLSLKGEVATLRGPRQRLLNFAVPQTLIAEIATRVGYKEFYLRLAASTGLRYRFVEAAPQVVLRGSSKRAVENEDMIVDPRTVRDFVSEL